MFRTVVRLSAMVATVASLTTSVAYSQATKAQTAVANALRTGNHVALAAAIETAAAAGTPISARYEYEDGKLQLSVFVAKGGAFSELFIDYTTGKVAKTDKITGGDDMKDAKAQNKAFAKAKSTLASAVQKALAENSGYTAVEATPVLQGKNVIADITLMKDGRFKDVTEPLD